MELDQPADVIPRGKPPRRSVSSPYSLPPASTSRHTLKSLVGRLRSATVPSSCPQLPPLDLGEEDTIWHPGQFIAVEPSSPVSEESERASTTSQTSYFSYSSERSFASRRLQRRPTDLSSILISPDPIGPLSPLKVALTTRANVWKTTGQPRVITKATMEGLIHYLLLKSAGERSTSPHHISSLDYLLIFAEEDQEQHDTFFIAHPAFIAPLNVLGFFIRRFDEAFMYPDEVRHDTQTRSPTSIVLPCKT